MEKPLYTLEFEKPLRELERQLDQLHQQSLENKLDLSAEISAIERKLEETKRNVYSNLSSWQRVQIARHPKRPNASDYLQALFKNFQELHGDRLFKDDQALIGGPAFFNGEAVMVLAQQKGRDTKENLARNFGMANPEGYRKALRLMRQAERFGLPIVSFIDTPGAYPGIGSEERHVAEAIAVNLREMSRLRVPIVAVVLGEGGSGGALGIAVADKVMIFENAYYSVISPESCAAILWRDAKEAARAAAALRLGENPLLAEFGVVDEVLPEPFAGAHNDPAAAAETLRAALLKHLQALRRIAPDDLIEQRYQRYRALGQFEEVHQARLQAAVTA